ncbi:MAG: hypothetical protein HYU51_13890 [Candidatus Rokubacteria bacterium]|nr:hypothetical protein [Candidatus Rokubacteria bacterium]
MIVVSILGVLAAIGFPIYSSMHQRARVAKAYGDARSMVGAVTLYASHNGSLPVALASLTQSSQNELGQTAGPFLVAVPASPSGWGAYSYTTATDGTYTISASGDGTTVRLP